jgi:hypothetical protein
VSWPVFVWMALGALLGALAYPIVVVAILVGRGFAGIAALPAHSR